MLIQEDEKNYFLQFKYHPLMVDVVKRIPGRKFDSKLNMWVIPKSFYPPGKYTQKAYVDIFANWAVKNGYEKSVQKGAQASRPDVHYTLPPMPELISPHGLKIEPFPYQKQGIAYALQKKRCFFGDQPGLGKMEPYSALIATPSGFRKMGDLRAGDELFGRDGNVYHVTGIFDHGVKDVYRFTFNDGAVCYAGLEHLWNVRDVNMRKRNQGWKTMSTEDILKKGLRWNISPSRKASGRKPILRWEIPVCDPVKYPHKNYIIHPYILGALIGDGNLCNGVVCLSNPDIDSDIHQKIKKLLPDYMRLRGDNIATCPRYCICNSDGKHVNHFLAEIRRLNIDVKSEDKFIPNEYLYGDIEQRIELLRGLMDTDGSITSGRARMIYHSMSRKLCDNVVELVQSLGGLAHIREYDRMNEGKSIEYQVAIVTRFNPFSTVRKAERYKIQRGNYCSRYIENIELDRKEECRCIKVDAPDELYLTDEFVVTHNTLQAIGTSFIAKTWPVLVICPASLKINWQREWKKFTGKDAIILDDRNKNNWHRYYEMGCCDVFITNYESLKKFFVEDFAGGVTRSIKLKPVASLFKCVIIDESHRCKSSKTQQSKICYKLCQGKEYRFLLTGTPSINGPGDLIQQLKIMNRLDDFGGYKSFEANFMGGPRQASNLEMLNWRLWNTCFFRREKAKVLDQLPDKMRQVVNVDITNRKEYQDAEHDLIGYLAAYENADDEKLRRAERGKVMVQMQKLRQIAARGKISAAVEFIQDIIDSGEKLIVFAFLKEVVQEIKKVFPNAVTIVGDNTSQERQDAVDRFQNDPKCNLIICNYKSAGVGLTLTASSRVAFVEFPWTFADCEQAEDRAHRIGQKNSVNCYYFLGKNTIDEDIWNLIQTKKDIANDVTGTDDQVPEKTVDAMILKMSAKSGIKKSETSTSPFDRRLDGALFSNAI